MTRSSKAGLPVSIAVSRASAEISRTICRRWAAKSSSARAGSTAQAAKSIRSKHLVRDRRVKEPLHKPHADRVAGEIGMIARSATKVVAWATMPRSATTRAPDFAATRMGWGFSGGLRRCSACEYAELFAAPRALHPIPKSLHRDRAGLVQRFLSLDVPAPAGVESTARVVLCDLESIVAHSGGRIMGRVMHVAKTAAGMATKEVLRDHATDNRAGNAA